MSRLSIVAKIRAKKEAAEFVRSELSKLVPPTRKEEGCIEYILHQDNDAPEVFIFYEVWESAAHLESHMGSDHFQRSRSATEGMIEERAVHKLTCLD